MIAVHDALRPVLEACSSTRALQGAMVLTAKVPREDWDPRREHAKKYQKVPGGNRKIIKILFATQNWFDLDLEMIIGIPRYIPQENPSYWSYVYQQP